MIKAVAQARIHALAVSRRASSFSSPICLRAEPERKRRHRASENGRQARLLHLDHLEIFCARVLQTLDVLRRETDLYPDRRPNEDPVATDVIESGFGPRSCEARLAPNPGGLELFGGEFSHGFVATPL
jgi:hypothetical protein